MCNLSKAFHDLAPETHEVIEGLLRDLYVTGDWSDEHEDILNEWRKARGEEAMDDWRWWIGEVGAETLAEDFATKDEALAAGRKQYAPDGRFEIMEARCWSDLVKEGEDVMWFAASRHKQAVEIAAND